MNEIEFDKNYHFIVDLGIDNEDNYKRIKEFATILSGNGQIKSTHLENIKLKKELSELKSKWWYKLFNKF